MSSIKRSEPGVEEVECSDPLTIFLYLLLRNDMPAGVVEGLVRHTVERAKSSTFVRGHLASYANSLAEQIKGATTEGLKTALSKAFDEEEKAKEVKARFEEKLAKSASESPEDIDWSMLEAKLIETSKKVEEGVDEEKIVTEPATTAVDELLGKGLITESEAEDLKDDIMSVVKFTEKEPEEVPPKENAEKITSEEAKKLVDSAVEEHHTIDTWLKERDISLDGYGVASIETDASIKWKNTHDELKKIEEEDENTESKE